MRNANLTRIAVLSTAAAICLGTAAATAVPASAHSLGGSKASGETTSTPPLADVQARVDAFIASWQQQLSEFAGRIAADPKLTAAQRAEYAAKLAEQQAALSSLKAAVDSATSVAAVHQAIRSAMSAGGAHGFFGWCGFFGPHQGEGTTRDHDRDAKDPAAAAQHDSDRSRTDPGRANPQARAVRTIALHSGQRAPAPRRELTASRHWSDDHSGARAGDYRGRHSAGQHATGHTGRHR